MRPATRPPRSGPPERPAFDRPTRQGLDRGRPSRHRPRRWWSDRLAGPSHPFVLLGSWPPNAGDRPDDPTPGIVINRPDPAHRRAAIEAADPVRRLRLGRTGGDPEGESRSEPRPRPRKKRRPSPRSTRPLHRSVAEVVRDLRDWEAIKNHQPMEMTTEPTIMGESGTGRWRNSAPQFDP